MPLNYFIMDGTPFQTRQSLFAKSPFLPIDSISVLDFLWKLRPIGPSFRSLLVDADTPVCVPQHGFGFH